MTVNLLRDETNRCKKGEHVNVTRMTQLLEEATVTAKSMPHLTRTRKCVTFFCLVDGYGNGSFEFELSEYERKRIGSCCMRGCDIRMENHVDEVLEDLDERIGGRLIMRFSQQ